MPANVDFGSVMADLSTFQQQIGKIHSRLTDPKQKEILGEALEKIRTARTDAVEHYPQAMDKIRQAGVEAQAEGKKQLAQAEAIKAKAAALAEKQKKAAAQKVKAPKAKLPATKPPAFNPQLGKKLRDEMLARFSDSGPMNDDVQTGDREIWDDWNLQ